jgi:hypothetical protein
MMLITNSTGIDNNNQCFFVQQAGQTQEQSGEEIATVQVCKETPFLNASYFSI